MKKAFITALSILAAVFVFGQTPDKVKWEYSYKSTGPKTGKIHAVAIIEHPWHIYAQVQPKEAVASPTKFVFGKNPLIVFIGKPAEIGKKETYENREVDIKQYQYADKVEFVQKVQLKAAVKTNLAGTVSYQVCDEERCLPVKVAPFTVTIDH